MNIKSLSLMLLVNSFTITAALAADFDIKDFTCSQPKGLVGSSIQMNLKATGKGLLKEGKPAKYTLNASSTVVYPGAKPTILADAILVTCHMEDVQVNCNSADENYNFYLYLDELDQAGMTTNGAKQELDCTPQEE